MDDHVLKWLRQHEDSLMAETPNNNSCVSNVAVVGNDVEQALLLDTRLRANDEYYLDTLRNNYGTGCSTILDIARISAKFNPFESSTVVFNKYIQAILASPFFSLKKYETTDHHRGDSNWNSAIDSIVGLYDGIQDGDRTKIKDSLVNLARSASTKKDIRNSHTMFLQSVLKLDQGTVTAYLYSSSIELEETTKKGFDSKQLDVSIKRLELSFNEQLWYQYAHLVNKKTVKLITDWITDNSVPETEELKMVKLCISD